MTLVLSSIRPLECLVSPKFEFEDHARLWFYLALGLLECLVSP